MVRDAAKNFTIRQVTGDKAYTSAENFQTVEDMGGVGYLAFKENATGGVGGIFERMFYQFCLQKDEYLRCYHRRSNVESAFSSIKRKFGDSVRSKTDVAMRNEVLAKIVCSNISQIIHLAHEFKIDLNFRPANDDPKNEDEPAILKFPLQA